MQRTEDAYRVRFIDYMSMHKTRGMPYSRLFRPIKKMSVRRTEAYLITHVYFLSRNSVAKSMD
jgi:hypothetical protein